MQNRLRVYVAGPYSAPTEAERLANTQRAIAAGLEIFALGHVPYIPHLTHYVDAYAQQSGFQMRWEDYITLDLAWLDLCDALLYLGPSRGADLELQYAKNEGKIIFHSIAGITRCVDLMRDVSVASERR